MTAKGLTTALHALRGACDTTALLTLQQVLVCVVVLYELRQRLVPTHLIVTL